MRTKVFRKLSILFTVLTLFADAGFFSTSSYSAISHQPIDSANQVTLNANPNYGTHSQSTAQKVAQASQIELEIAPPKTNPPKKEFSDRDKLEELTEMAPKNGDSCFPVLYGEKELISLDFQNANIINLFRIIAEFSGFNLILSPELSGFVDVRMFDVPWNKALEIVLANSALGRECFGENAVRIASIEKLDAEAALKAANVKDGNGNASSKNKDSCFPIFSGNKEHVSLDFQNVHIKNLFRIISEVSGFNLILSPDVSGFVNIRMLDVPWNEALEIILANNALGRECFADGVVRIANIESLNKNASKIIESTNKSAPRMMGKELNDVPPIPMHIYNRIQSEFPELLEKMSHFESLFNNKDSLQKISDDEYNQAIEKYRNLLKSVDEIKTSKTSLQKDYQLLRLKGIILMNNERVALFETNEQKGFSARKGDLIGPSFGYIDDIQSEKVIVVEKLRNYMGVTVTKEHSLEFSID